MKENDAALKEKLVLETARIGWRQLEKFWAKGQVVHVGDHLDLIEAGVALAKDDTNRVQHWMQQGSLAPVSKQQAQKWHDASSEVWALVIAPWVLVQNASIPKDRKP